MDWVKILEVLGGLAAVLMSWFGVRWAGPRLRPRARLKADLEILNMLDPVKQKNYYKLVRNNIETAISKLYESTSKKGSLEGGFKLPRVRNWSVLIFGFFAFLGFTYWTWYIVRDGFSWWAILTGWFAFTGAAYIRVAFLKPHPRLSKVKDIAFKKVGSKNNRDRDLRNDTDDKGT